MRISKVRATKKKQVSGAFITLKTMNDMQKLGVFLASVLDKLSDVQTTIAAYQARIAELEAQQQNGGSQSSN